MAATFSWVEFTTTAGDTGVPTNVNLGSTIARDLPPSTYPITAGTYSYSKWIRAYFGGTFTRIENIQFWKSSGTYDNGETILSNVRTSGYDGTTTYGTPTNSAESKGGTMGSIPTADPTAANVGIGGSLSGSLTSVGYGDFMILQMSVPAGATAGATTTKRFTLQYDEIS